MQRSVEGHTHDNTTRRMPAPTGAMELKVTSNRQTVALWGTETNLGGHAYRPKYMPWAMTMEPVSSLAVA